MRDCYFPHFIDEVKGRCNLFLASWLENAKLQILKAYKDGKAAEHFILEQGRCFLCPFTPAVVSPLSKCSKPHIKGCTSHIFLSFAFWLFLLFYLFIAFSAMSWSFKILWAIVFGDSVSWLVSVTKPLTEASWRRGLFWLRIWEHIPSWWPGFEASSRFTVRKQEDEW